MWRSIVLIAFASVLFSAQVKADSPKWQSIFNGKDLTGWQPKIRGFAFGDNHLNTFRVEQGYLTVSYQEYQQFDEKFGHLFYMHELSHYRLRFSYRFIGEQVKGGPKWAYKNSGVMLHGQHPNTMTLGQSFPVSIEAQLLGAEPKQHRPTANVCTPATHISINQKQETKHCFNSTSKSFIGEQWVEVMFEVVENKTVKHWVNGELVFTYSDLVLDKSDEDAQRLLAKGASLELKQGYFSLQAESHPIQFKQIELLNLAPSDTHKASVTQPITN